MMIDSIYVPLESPWGHYRDKLGAAACGARGCPLHKATATMHGSAALSS